MAYLFAQFIRERHSLKYSSELKLIGKNISYYTQLSQCFHNL